MHLKYTMLSFWNDGGSFMKVHFKRFVMGSIAFLFLMAPLGLCAVFGSRSMNDVASGFYESYFHRSQSTPASTELKQQLNDLSYWHSQAKRFGKLSGNEGKCQATIERDFSTKKIELEQKLAIMEKQEREAFDNLRFGTARYYAWLHRKELLYTGAGLAALLATYAAHAKGYDRSAWNHTYGALPESLQNGLEWTAKRALRLFVYGGRNVINKTVEVGGRVKAVGERVQNALAENE